MRSRSIKAPFEDFGEYESANVQKKGSVKVGESYICTPGSPFSGQIRAQVSRIYKNSARVRILSCIEEKDDEIQRNLNDVTVVSLKKIHEVC